MSEATIIAVTTTIHLEVRAVASLGHSHLGGREILSARCVLPVLGLVLFELAGGVGLACVGMTPMLLMTTEST